MATLRQQIATNMLRVTRFRDLTKAVSTYRPNDDLEIIRRAYDFSLQNHTGQSRASGEPYVVHPLEVAMILADMKMDANAIAAGLLHDCVEDTIGDDRRRAQRIRRAGRASGRRRHQDQQNRFRHPRRAPGRESAQDDARHGRRRPRGAHQTRRPPAQYAHARCASARSPREDRPRDAGDLRSDRAPTRHGQNPRRTRRPRVPIRRSHRLPAGSRRSRAAPQRRAKNSFSRLSGSSATS